MDDTIKNTGISTSSSTDLLTQMLPAVGSSGVTTAIALYLIKRWINGMLLKIASIDSVHVAIAEMKSDHKQILEKLAELKHPIQKVDQIDKQVAVLDAKAEAAHRRLDEIMQFKLNN